MAETDEQRAHRLKQIYEHVSKRSTVYYFKRVVEKLIILDPVTAHSPR